MAEKERAEAKEAMKPIVELKTTPEIEKAIVEQMRALPEAIKLVAAGEKTAWSCFGLIVCCNGASAMVRAA